MPKYNIKVKLSGKDGNVFNLASVCLDRFLEEDPESYRKDKDVFIIDMMSSKSYDEALSKLHDWFDIY